MSLKARKDYRELRVRREMLPYRLPEDNVSRRRAQFSKDERLHLLSIMTQYEPLLDDKNASVFDRREIWRAIERDFHQAGFTRKTSAQLKKYWQNYKYHGRRAQVVKKRSSSTSRDATKETVHPEIPGNHGNLEMTKITKESATPFVPSHSDTSLRNVVESGCRQREIYENNGTFFRILSATSILPTDIHSFEENRSISEISQRKIISSEVYEESRSSDVIDRKSEKRIGADVIVSNTDVSDNSVTVSVICPERTSELFNKNFQPKRKREDDTSLDRSSFQSHVSVASAASSGKKRKDDEQFIFPTVAGAAKGRCFLLQPRQTDNGEVISDRRNATVETHRKLELAKKISVALPSTFASRNEISKSATKNPAITTENFSKDFAASRVEDIRESKCRGGRCESKIYGAATSQNQRDDLDTSDPARPSISVHAGLWDQNTVSPVESELTDEINYQLILHRLETEEKRLKVKLAEMAIQEIRFRIRAVNEDIRRADELHELHLALATAQAQDTQDYTFKNDKMESRSISSERIDT